jgi:hypothetical protein
MPSRLDFIKISQVRLIEVKVLNRKRLYDGAKYISGYVIEAALKARICKILDADYPDSGEIAKSFLTHKFDILIKLGGLQKQLDDELSSNINFKTNWSIVTNWSESFRYKPFGSSNQTEITDLLLALEDNNDGVSTWIKNRW